MLSLPRLIAVAALALFLLALFHVGYINEHLKGVLDPWQRVTLMSGFVIGAGTVSRYLISIGERQLARRKKRAAITSAFDPKRTLVVVVRGGL